MTKFKSAGWTDEEIEKISCINGSLTCGLRTRLGYDNKCPLCKKDKRNKDNEVAQFIYTQIHLGNGKKEVLKYIEKNWQVYKQSKGQRRC